MKTHKSQKTIANGSLLDLLRNGKLPVNKKNADFVKTKYCKAVKFNEILKSAGLQHLEDPEKEFDEQMYEEWLADAFYENFGSKDEAIEAIKSVRAAVLASI